MQDLSDARFRRPFAFTSAFAIRAAKSFQEEGIDVGIDRRSPVSWSLFQRRGSFPFTGELTAATYTPSPIPADELEHMLAHMRDFALALE